MELPTWQHQPGAGPSPAELQQALTRQAEPTWSKPQARLRAGSADPGREKGADPGNSGWRGVVERQVAAQPGFGGKRWL